MPQKPSPKRLSKFFFDGQHKFQATFAKQKRITNMRIATIINIRARTCTYAHARVRTYRTHVYARMREKTFVRNLPATDSFLPLRVTLSRTDATKAEKFPFCPVDGMAQKGNLKVKAKKSDKAK